MNFFEVIFSNISSYIREIPDVTWGGIIFGILLGSLICFLYATKGSKKDKLIQNYFLFYLSITLVIIGLVLTFIK